MCVCLFFLSVCVSLTVCVYVVYVCTVEPLNKDTFGTSCFVLCREVVLFQG